MAASDPAPVYRQYFEHPPRSHLYQGTVTATASGATAASLPEGQDSVGCTAFTEGRPDKHASSSPNSGDDGPINNDSSEFVPPRQQQQQRALSTVLLTGLMYTFTISGAYGIEESVMGGGVLLTIVSILVIPVLMGGPTALVVAELAAAVPSNAGFLMWIKLSFHRTVYLAMAIMSVIYTATDNALYPTLFSEYFCTAVTCSAAGEKWLRLGMLALTFFLNALGVQTVGLASVILTVLTVLPFVLIYVEQQLSTGFYVNWPAVVYVPTGSINWAQFFATASWCLSGMEQAGTVVEDVKDPQRTIVHSLIPLMGLAFVTYIPPVIAGASVSSDEIDLSQWTTGYWAEVAFQVGGTWLKAVTVIGSVLSAFGLSLSALCTTTRIFSGMALTEAVPGRAGEWLSYRSPRFGTYPYTLAVNTALTALFSIFMNFSGLVRMDQCLYGIRVIMIFLSFYRMRQLYPHLERPFRIPLEGWKLHGMLGCAFASFVALTIISALDWTTALLCMVVVAASSGIAYVYCTYYRTEDFSGRVVTEEVPLPSATPDAERSAQGPTIVQVAEAHASSPREV